MPRKTRPVIETDANFRELKGFEFSTEFRGDYTGTNLIYAGFARQGSAEGSLVWQIFRMSYDVNNNLTAIMWPQVNGTPSNDFEFSWTARATYTYS